MALETSDMPFCKGDVPAATRRAGATPADPIEALICTRRRLLEILFLSCSCLPVHHVHYLTLARQTCSAGCALQEIRSLHAAGLLGITVPGGLHRRCLCAAKRLACWPGPEGAAEGRTKHKCRVCHQNDRQGRPRQGAVSLMDFHVTLWVPLSNCYSTSLDSLVRVSSLPVISRQPSYPGGHA